MERKIFLGILGATLLALALAVFLPGGRTVDQHPKLPWLIQIDPEGFPTIFGLTLEKSTLADAREIFQQKGKTNLFVSPDNELAFETYFEKLYLSGLRASMVLTLSVDDQTATRIYERGLRISQLGTGSKKVKLAEPDVEALGQAPVAHITYIPGSNLEPELIANRFGEPQRRIGEASGVTHWLYPDRGLDIAVNPDGKEVFQYISPANFHKLVQPLEVN
ncbi:MAG: hypothetical protein GY703_01250 [Gammaproteobacteria bacterium]|nr:hypothetical protein [Gammaproteobacteria bacterium]